MSPRLGPHLSARCRDDQLDGDPYAVRRLAHRTFQNVANAKLDTHLLHVDRPALVRERRAARYDEQPFDAGEPCDDVVHYSVRKILLRRIPAEIGERQHGDRWLIGQRQRGSRSSVVTRR